jgi:hypothetical protein
MTGKTFTNMILKTTIQAGTDRYYLFHSKTDKFDRVLEDTIGDKVIIMPNNKLCQNKIIFTLIWMI